MYFWGRGVFVGLSAAQLTKGYVKFGNQNINFDPKMHFFFTGGYKAVLNNRWDMTSALLIKYMQPAPLSVEASFILDYNEQFFFGMSYRHKDAVIAQLGMTISEMFEIGYSYDFTVSKLRRYNSGGHELVLKFKFGNAGISTSKI
jgi:type IX secretion system PorP/SprF family membrane protein